MLGRLKFDIEDLVEVILDQIPGHIWESEATTFLDPAIGGGQFVVAIERKLRKYGHSNKNIAKRVFGYEDNVLRINYAINKHKLVGNYQAKEFLKEEFDMKFDVVLGNPPFNFTSSDGGGVSGTIGDKTVYRKFTKKAVSITKKDGHIAFITLKNILSTLKEMNIQVDIVDYMTKVDYWKYNTLYFIARNTEKQTSHTVIDPIISKIVSNNDFGVLTQPASLMQNIRSGLVLQKGNSVLVKLNGQDPAEYSDLSNMKNVAKGPKFAFTMLESIKSYTATDCPMLAGCVRYIPTDTIAEAEKLKLFTLHNKALRYFSTVMKSKSHAGSLAMVKKFNLSQIVTGKEYPIEWGLTKQEIEYIEQNVK
jgi:hypothetical protein